MPTAWNNRTTITTAWDQRVDYLEQEDRFYLLLEDSGKIVLSGVNQTPWTDRAVI